MASAVPVIWVLAGPNGAGKSTYYDDFVSTVFSSALPMVSDESGHRSCSEQRHERVPTAACVEPDVFHRRAVVDRIEPCLLDQYPVELADTISELVKLSSALGQRLHPRTAASLAELVRVMNCYYSNLIEGHTTRPRDIERALHDQLDSDPPPA